MMGGLKIKGSRQRQVSSTSKKKSDKRVDWQKGKFKDTWSSKQKVYHNIAVGLVPIRYIGIYGPKAGTSGKYHVTSTDWSNPDKINMLPVKRFKTRKEAMSYVDKYKRRYGKK